MCQECPVSLEKLSFFFILVKIIQVLVFDNWHPLKAWPNKPLPGTMGVRLITQPSASSFFDSETDAVHNDAVKNFD